MEKKFTHLHVHTDYSLLSGVGNVKKLVKRAKELGMDSLAITDNAVMYGCVDFYKESIKNGIKPILGCEVEINFRDKKNWQMVLLVKDSLGYSNLLKIISNLKTNNDQILNYIEKYSCGLIVIVSCYTYEFMEDINCVTDTKDFLSQLKCVFNDDLYLEIQNHGLDIEKKINSLMIEISNSLKINLVATNNVYYVDKSDADAHQLLLCIQQGTTLDKVNKRIFKNSEYYLKSYEEMNNQFFEMQIALQNTQVIVSKCNFEYEFHIPKIPKYPLEADKDPYEYLENLCFNGIETYLTSLKIKHESPDYIAYHERLKYELSVIKEMGYIDYFLIVRDFIEYAKNKKIATGPGRGSGAGSLVAFVLGITKIDPLKYGLVFERFLNPERISMPDIDCDFCFRRRQEVIDYVFSKYGRDKVSQIITFGTFAAKTVIRDFGKALNMPLHKIEKIIKMIPVIRGKTLSIAESKKEVRELKALIDEDLSVRLLLELCEKIEGNVRHISTHAAGVVIAAEPIVNLVPIENHEGVILTQFGMTTLEELGLLKIDLLGLKTLTVLNDTVELIKHKRHIFIDLDKIDYNDEEVYRMLGEGKTVGVFQLESDGMTSFIKELAPNCLEDIIAGISLYRPGPMAEIPKYLKNKKNPEKIEYLSPALKPILDVTYGCLIYQEQVMQIVRNLGGYSMGRSDLVRRAMSKKKHDIMDEERKTFVFGKVVDGVVVVPGCVRHGINAEIGNKIFDSMVDFASYAFNKSHAVSYAVLAYQTAYLIRYFPAEYITAKINSVIDDKERVSFYIDYAKERNILVNGPEINNSIEEVSCVNGEIILGFEIIKNVGKNVARHIINCRLQNGNYLSFEDFMRRVDLKIINKKIIESFIKSGVFDAWGKSRSQLMAVYDKEYDYFFINKKNELFGQMTLFSYIDDYEIEYPNISEYELGYLLNMEKETMGGWTSQKLIGKFLKFINLNSIVQIKDILKETLKSDYHYNNYLIVGVVIQITYTKTKDGKKMLFMKIEDVSGIIEVVVFPSILVKYEDYIDDNKLLLVEGGLSLKKGKEVNIICQRIQPLQESDALKLYIRIEDKKESSLVKKIFETHLRKYLCGSIPTYVYVTKEKQVYQLSEQWWISLDDVSLHTLEQKFGKSNVKVIRNGCGTDRR